MSKQFLREDFIEITCSEQEELNVDVKLSNLSERLVPNVGKIPLRKIRTESQIESGTNYDDLCGPWTYPRNPFYSRYVVPPCPSLCIWKYFTAEDLTYLKKYQDNRSAIYCFFEQKFRKDNMADCNILKEILWDCFKFARLHLFTERSVSACLGIIYLTHSFFLSYPWRTTEEICDFFYKTVLLHVVLYPPRSLEVFTVTEGKLMFELFHKIYVENLVLFHILCHPNYHFTLKLQSHLDT